jgi:hypothetical protein
MEISNLKNLYKQKILKTKHNLYKKLTFLKNINQLEYNYIGGASDTVLKLEVLTKGIIILANGEQITINKADNILYHNDTPIIYSGESIKVKPNGTFFTNEKDNKLYINGDNELEDMLANESISDKRIMLNGKPIKFNKEDIVTINDNKKGDDFLDELDPLPAPVPVTTPEPKSVSDLDADCTLNSDELFLAIGKNESLIKDIKTSIEKNVKGKITELENKIKDLQKEIKDLKDNNSDCSKIQIEKERLEKEKITLEKILKDKENCEAKYKEVITKAQTEINKQNQELTEIMNNVKL